MRPKEETIAEDVKELIAFKLGEEEFGVDIKQIKEIANLTDVTRVPNVPSFVEGVTNLRGKITPIVDLRKKFGLKSKGSSKDSRIVIAELDGHLVGLIVDEVTDVLNMPARDIDPAPELIASAASKRYLKGIGKVGEKRLIILLDLEKLLSKEEFIDITEVKAKNDPRRGGSP